MDNDRRRNVRGALKRALLLSGALKDVVDALVEEERARYSYWSLTDDFLPGEEHFLARWSTARTCCGRIGTIMTRDDASP